MGERRVDRRRGRRVRPLAAQPLPGDRGADEPRARPPLHLRLAARAGGDDAGVPRVRGLGGDLGPPRAAGPRPRGRSSFDVADPSSCPGGSTFSWDGHRGGARGPGRPQRGQRRRRTDGLPAGRRGPGGRGRARCGPSAARDGASSGWGDGRRGARSTTTTPTTRPRSAATLRAARTLEPAARGRGLPAAPVLAHGGAVARVRRGARRWPTSWSCSTSIAPARTRGLARGERPAGRRGRGGRRRGPRRWPGCPDSTRRARISARRCGRAICC